MSAHRAVPAMSPTDREHLIRDVMENAYRRTATFHDTQVPLWRVHPNVQVWWRGLAREAVDTVKGFYEGEE